MNFTVLLCLLTGVGIRIILAMHACGSYDLAQVFFWGTLISERGLAEAYSVQEPYPSHPPLGFLLHGLFVLFAGGNEGRFGLTFRLFTSAIDLISLWLLVIAVGRGEVKRISWLVALWAVMPYILIQAAFHANLDSLVGLFLLLGTILYGSRKGLSGATVAGAACIKIPALLPLAALAAASLVHDRKGGIRFCCGALIPLVLFLFSPALVIPNYLTVLFLRYRGMPAPYGPWAIFPQLHTVTWTSTALPLFLCALATFLACWRIYKGYKVKPSDLVICALLPVMFASRGFGIQYFYWIVPLLPLISQHLWSYAFVLVTLLSLLNLSMVWELLHTEQCVGPLGYRHLDWIPSARGGTISLQTDLVLAAAVWIFCLTLWLKLVLSIPTDSEEPITITKPQP